MPKLSSGDETEAGIAAKPVDADDAVSISAVGKGERSCVALLTVAALFLSSLPYIAGWLHSTPDHRFVGYTYNVDDAYVYMSWARQAADGHFFNRNLFTLDPQLGRQFNVYFLLVGGIVHLTHLPIQTVMQFMRVGFGAALLLLIHRLYLLLLPGSYYGRMTAFALTCFGTGLGFLFAPRWADKNVFTLPSDTWQPEGFTFISLEFSSLFVVSTFLIVASLYFLLRGERTGQTRDAVYAGVCGFLLGNIHTYDVIHVIAVWALYLVVTGIVTRTFDAAGWGRAVVAGLMTAPTAAYQFYLWVVDPVFHKRVADPTLSFGFKTYAMGYGLTMLLAVVAAALWIRSRRFRAEWANDNAALFPICWAVAAFVLVYIPFSFQRKMIMGLHVPLCLLAGAAAAYGGRYLASRVSGFVSGAWLVPALAVLLSVPSSILWVMRDVNHIRTGTTETNSPNFLSGDDYALFNWIRSSTTASATFVTPAPEMLFIPGLCDRAVWCGHWGETPDYAHKMGVLGSLVRPPVEPGSEEMYRQYVTESTQAQYLIWPNYLNTWPVPPAYLVPVYTSSSWTVYAIR